MTEEITKLFEKRVEELYNSLMEKPLKILEIFNDFFGEDKVDIQGYPSLDEFKSWINTTPIYYYTSKEILHLTPEDWITYRDKYITDLPEDLTDTIIMALTRNTVKDKISCTRFQNIFILIHFPHVRVTNEHDRFVDINHLWAKVKILCNGTIYGTFSLNRSEYTMLHIMSNYMHSHVSTVPRYNFTEFQTPCTGSGPINGTMSTLNREYNEDMWKMFCLELSKYVTVESIAGRPYNYLERLGTENMEEGTNRYIPFNELICHRRVDIIELLREFIKHFISLKKLKFNYINGSYSIGMPFIEYIVLISNEFIKFYNNKFNEKAITYTFEKLKSYDILEECVISNGKLYYDRDMGTIDTYSQFIGKKVCTFKGKEITINITDITEIESRNKSIILNVPLALYILTTILKILNYRYGRDKAIHKDNQFGTEVRYL